MNKNIKINEKIIPDVRIVDSGDVLGIRFNTTMTLTELDNAFSPETSPTFYIVEDDGAITGVYKNHKLVSIRVAEGVVDIAMIVTKGEISDVDKLISQIEAQENKIKE